MRTKLNDGVPLSRCLESGTARRTRLERYSARDNRGTQGRNVLNLHDVLLPTSGTMGGTQAGQSCPTERARNKKVGQCMRSFAPNVISARASARSAAVSTASGPKPRSTAKHGQTAESRVATRKSAKEEAEARATAERQAALERLGEIYLQFAATPEGVGFLEAHQAELIAPRNDGEYVKAALARDREREVAANETTTVHHWVEWGRNYLSLTLRNDRDHAKAREVSAILQRLLEAELRYHADPHDKTRSADYAQKRTPKHEFGRTSRSKKR